MPQDDAAQTKATPGRALELDEGGDRKGAVRLVIERRDAPLSGLVGSDPPDEQDHSAEFVPRERTHRAGHGKAPS